MWFLLERLSLPLGAWDGLRYFIVALPNNDKELKELQWNDIESISNFKIHMINNNFLSSLLRTPGIGAVSFVGEAVNLQSAVYDCSSLITEKDHLNS